MFFVERASPIPYRTSRCGEVEIHVLALLSPLAWAEDDKTPRISFVRYPRCLTRRRYRWSDHCPCMVHSGGFVRLSTNPSFLLATSPPPPPRFAPPPRRQKHYYTSHPALNTYAIVPIGPDFLSTLKEPHNRDRVF